MTTQPIKNDYAHKTFWSITASKAKQFRKDPLLYKIKYLDLICEEDQEKKCFLVGTAFHYIMEFWKEAFLEKYYIDEWLVKKKLAEYVIDFHWDDRDTEKIKSFKKLLLPEVRAEYMKITNNEWKIELTPAEWRDIIGMYGSALEQPLRDMWSQYINEHRFEAMYWPLKLSAQLDRRSVSDSNGMILDLSSINELLYWKARDEQKKIINDLGLVSSIRDFKTCWDIAKLHKELKRWDESKDYIFSMSFYYCIVYVLYGLESTVYLDVVESKAPYVTDTISVADYILKDSLETKIKHTLDSIIKAEKTGEYACRSRDERITDSSAKLYLKHHPDYKQTVPTVLEIDL